MTIENREAEPRPRQLLSTHTPSTQLHAHHIGLVRTRRRALLASVNFPMHRLHCSGIGDDVDEQALAGRFKPFGTVHAVEIVRTPDRTCRGFGYVSLEASEESIAKCLKVYRGAKWRGRTFSVEAAKPDFLTRLQACITPFDTTLCLRLRAHHRTHRPSGRRPQPRRPRSPSRWRRNPRRQPSPSWTASSFDAGTCLRLSRPGLA